METLAVKRWGALVMVVLLAGCTRDWSQYEERAADGAGGAAGSGYGGAAGTGDGAGGTGGGEPSPVCGNGVIEGREHCDGIDLGGETCGSLGEGRGTLSCTSSCLFDLSMCSGYAAGSGGYTGVSGDFICEDTCLDAYDGYCDDGGPDSDYSVCDYGTDCGDCGPRP